MEWEAANVKLRNACIDAGVQFTLKRESSWHHGPGCCWAMDESFSLRIWVPDDMDRDKTVSIASSAALEQAVRGAIDLINNWRAQLDEVMSFDESEIPF